MPLQPGDVPETSADIKHTTEILGRKPGFQVEKGIENLIQRYKEFYNY